MSRGKSIQRGPSLLDITAELKPYEEALKAAGGDVEQVDPATLENLGALLTQSAEKVDGYGRRATELSYKIDAINAEIKRLSSRKRAMERDLEGLKWLAKKAMKMRGRDTLDGTLHSLSIEKNGGKRPMWIKVDPENMPDRFRIYEPMYVVNTEALRAALEAGDPEAIQYAELEEQGDHLKVR